MELIRPLGNKVIVKIVTFDNHEKKLESGIVIPGSNTEIMPGVDVDFRKIQDKIEKKGYGEVVAVGLGAEIVESGIKKGDIIIYSKFSGDEVVINQEDIKLKEKVRFVAIHDILGVVTNE